MWSKLESKEVKKEVGKLQSMQSGRSRWNMRAPGQKQRVRDVGRRHTLRVCKSAPRVSASTPAHGFKYRNWAKVPADLNNAIATMKTVHAALVPFHCWKRGSVEQREERRGREGRGKAWFLWTLSRPHSGLRCQELNRTRARHSSARRMPELKTERPEPQLTSLSLSMSASQLQTCTLLDNQTWLKKKDGSQFCFEAASRSVGPETRARSWKVTGWILATAHLFPSGSQQDTVLHQTDSLSISANIWG